MMVKYVRFFGHSFDVVDEAYDYALKGLNQWLADNQNMEIITTQLEHTNDDRAISAKIAVLYREKL